MSSRPTFFHHRTVSPLHITALKNTQQERNTINESTEAGGDLPVLTIFARARSEASQEIVYRDKYTLHRGKIPDATDNMGVRLELNKITDPSNQTFCAQIPPEVCATVLSAFLTDKTPTDKMPLYLANMPDEEKLTLLADLFYSSDQYRLTDSIKKAVQGLINPSRPAAPGEEAPPPSIPREQALRPLKGFITSLVNDIIQISKQKIANQSSTTRPVPDTENSETASSQGSMRLGSMFQTGADDDKSKIDAPDDSSSESGSIFGDREGEEEDAYVSPFSSSYFNFDEKIFQDDNSVADQSQETSVEELDIELQAQRWLVVHALTTLLHMNSKDIFILLKQLKLIPKDLEFAPSNIFTFLRKKISEFNDDKYDDVKEAIMVNIVHLVSEGNTDVRGTRITVNENNIDFIGELIQSVFEQGKNNPFLVKSIWQWIGEAMKEKHFWQSHSNSVPKVKQQKFATQLLNIIANNCEHFIAFRKHDNMKNSLKLLARIVALSYDKKATVETKNKIGYLLNSICQTLRENTEDKEIIDKFLKKKVAPLLPQSAEEFGQKAPPVEPPRRASQLFSQTGSSSSTLVQTASPSSQAGSTQSNESLKSSLK